MAGLKVVLLGATGMVGQGVLRECLVDGSVERVLAIGRTPTGKQDPKLCEVSLPDFSEFRKIEAEVEGYDACFFCLGATSVGKTEAEYRAVTYDLTMMVAETLVKTNPGMTFIYVTGQGTDSSERGRIMWARVKGQTENALLRMPFKAAYMFRPGYIQPVHGVKTRLKWIGAIYAVAEPLYPLMKAVLRGQILTTECVGKAMIAVAKDGAEKRVLEAKDINRICEGAQRVRGA